MSTDWCNAKGPVESTYGGTKPVVRCAEASGHVERGSALHKNGSWRWEGAPRRARRPCVCGHGISKHRDRGADSGIDGRSSDRNTSCTVCGCGEFLDESAA